MAMKLATQHGIAAAQFVAIDILRNLVNCAAPAEFIEGKLCADTLIVGRSYKLDSVNEEAVCDFCEKVARELIVDIRNTERKQCVELPHVEREDLRSELVTDRQSHLSMRMTVMPDYLGSVTALIRCEVGLN